MTDTTADEPYGYDPETDEDVLYGDFDSWVEDKMAEHEDWFRGDR